MSKTNTTESASQTNASTQQASNHSNQAHTGQAQQGQAHTGQAQQGQAQQAHQGQASKARSPWEIPFAPFAMPMPDVFSQMMRDQIARTHAAMSELAVYEGVAVQRARTAVDDLARLANDSIGYVGQLAAEWRKLSLETMQRTADAFAPRS